MVIEEEDGRPGFIKVAKEKLKHFIQTNKMLSGLSFVAPHIARKLRDAATSAQLVVYHEPNSVISDEFRILRTHILHTNEEEFPPKTLLLTSTLKGEGKSTTASNLAITIADSGRKTLLVDCDLRKGQLREMFSLPPTKGLSDLLTGGADIDAAVKSTKINNLYVIPAGSKNSKPSELLDSPQMSSLINKLKDRYEYVILDSPPIIKMPDASILSRLVDAVILVIQAGRAKKVDVALAKEKLDQVDTRMAGFVFTNVQYYMPRYIYDYYYSYN
jgi:capsular exopolysaccharide synthesis family protein